MCGEMAEQEAASVRSEAGHAAGPLATPAAERRLTHRLMSYWERQRNGRDFPSLKDIKPDELPELWPSCFVLDTGASLKFPYFHYLGGRLAKQSGTFLSGRQDWRLSLLDKAVYKFRAAVADRRPILTEDQVTLYDGTTLLYRSILLPLSDDQETVNFVLGGADGKLVRKDEKGGR